MFKQISSLIFLGILFVGVSVLAGSFTPSPATPDAGPYTLSDIYNQTASSTYAYSPHAFAPASAPASTFVTLEDVWNIIPPFITLTPGGLSSGLLPNGIYSTTTDLTAIEPNLVVSNIATGTSIFGVEGSCRGVPSDGLISFWPFDDGTASDPFGGYDGTVDGATLATGINGQPDTAYNFDGADDRIDFPSSILSSVKTQTGTWCMWLYSDNLLDNRKVMMFGDADADSYVQLELSSSTGQGIRAKSRNSAGAVAWQIHVNDSSTYEQGDPYIFICLVHDGAGPAFYVNGAKPAQSYMENLDPTIWLGDIPGIDKGQIGCADKNEALDAWHPLLGHDYFSGSIDEVRVYNKNLNEDEINYLYNL